MTDETLAPATPDPDSPPAGHDREFPMPLKAFQATLVKTHDEIWSHLLGLTCRGQNHTRTEWQDILAQLRTQKA